MNKKEICVNLLYRHCMRCLSLQMEDRGVSIEKMINTLFEDMNCRCIALKAQDDLEMVFLSSIEKDHTILFEMVSHTVDYIQVIGESRIRLLP